METFMYMNDCLKNPLCPCVFVAQKHSHNIVCSSSVLIQTPTTLFSYFKPPKFS